MRSSRKQKETYFQSYFQIKIPWLEKFPFPRVNDISPAGTRLLNTDYKIVYSTTWAIKSTWEYGVARIKAKLFLTVPYKVNAFSLHIEKYVIIINFLHHYFAINSINFV